LNAFGRLADRRIKDCTNPVNDQGTGNYTQPYHGR